MAEDHCSFNDVFQLSDVPWIGVSLENRTNLWLNVQHLFAEFLPIPHKRSHAQWEDVFHSLPQWGEFEGHDVQTEKQVFTECAARHLLLEVTVGGRDKAEVYLNVVHATHATERAFLQDPQQFGLHHQIQITDLVQKHRPSLGLFEEAQLPLVGAGECATLVAEELALEQFPRDRRAVDTNKGACSSDSIVVQDARDEFFPCAGLALKQHCSFRIQCHVANLCDQLLHRRTIGNQIGQSILALHVLHFERDPSAQ